MPIRLFKDSSLVEHFWPHEADALAWACNLCSHLTLFRHEDVHQLPADLFGPPPSDRGFWRVEMACCRPGCPDHVVGYTQTFGQTSRRELAELLATADPFPTCASGFTPALPAFPLSLDFVEWTGGDDYLA